MGSCAEKRSDLTSSRFYMENVSTACNVRVKRCSTVMTIGHASSPEEQKQNSSHDRASEERSSCHDGQCPNANTSNLLNELCCSDTSCISRLNARNTVVENGSNDTGRQNNGSGSYASVESFLSSGEAFNDPPNVYNKTSRKSEESANNHVERSMQGSEPCAVASSKNTPVRESSPKAEASVCSEEKGESSSTSMSFRAASHISNPEETKECKDKQRLSIEQTDNADLPLPSRPADTNSGSDPADEEVRVCDICGDVGREDLLAVCHKCNDGAEHIYCMRVKMNKVPAGDWCCEDCEINQESLREGQKKVEEAEKLLKRSYSITQKRGSSGLSNLKKRLQVDIGASGFEKKTANSVSRSPKLPLKISSGNSEALPITKKRTVETHDESPRDMAEGDVKPFPLNVSARGIFPVGKSRLLKSKSFNFGEAPVEDRQQQQGDERKSAVPKDHGKGDKSRIFRKSQSFREVRAESSVRDISKAKKMLFPTSPRVNSQSRPKQIEEHSLRPRKSIAKLGSSKGDDKTIARGGKLPSKPSAIVNRHDRDTIQGREQSSNASKLSPAKKSSRDQHEEKYSIVNRSSRRLLLDNLVPSQRGIIPQVDFIWKGEFEVSTSEGLTNVFPCVQAHKSNRACDKVDAVAMKLPPKIVLEEAPRASMWPAQFKDTRETEDNIAVFFFAENVESYGAYESLLKHITVNDLALKGFAEGVELLVFSSKVLPPDSQRWNSLLYLWGVFRITGVSSSENEPASQNRLPSPTGSPEPQHLVTKYRTAVGQPSSNGWHPASSGRVSEISEPAAYSSGPKPSSGQAIYLQAFSLGEESDLYKSRKLDLKFGTDNNTRDLAFSVSHDEERPNKKMKGIAVEPPEPCTLGLINFFEAAPAFDPKNGASSSAKNAAVGIPRGEEQSTVEELNLELSLGPTNYQTAKRKAFSMSVEALNYETSPMKRLRKDENELSLSLTLAPPS